MYEMQKMLVCYHHHLRLQEKGNVHSPLYSEDINTCAKPFIKYNLFFSTGFILLFVLAVKKLSVKKREPQMIYAF